MELQKPRGTPVSRPGLPVWAVRKKFLKKMIIDPKLKNIFLKGNDKGLNPEYEPRI